MSSASISLVVAKKSGLLSCGEGKLSMATEMTDGNARLGLAVIPLFKQLAPAPLEKMSGLMVKVSFKAGDTVFLANEPGDALYVIDSGSVRIWVRDGDANAVTLSELEPGDFFGEMSVLDGGK